MAIRPVKKKFQIDVAVTRDGKTIRHRETVGTYAEAQIREADVKAALLKGEPVKPITAAPQDTPSEYTLRRCIEGTYNTYWRQCASGRNLYHNAVRIADFFGDDYDIRKLDFAEIERYKEHLMAQELGTNTVNRLLVSVSKVCVWALHMRLIKDKPRITYFKKTTGRTRYLTDAEERAVLEFFTAAGMDDYADVVVVLIDTGARPSEIFKRPRTELDTVKGKFHFWDTKTSKSRSVPLTARALAAAVRVWPKIKAKEITYRSFLIHWNGMKNALGLKDDKEFCPYALRHTCCTRLIGRGADLVTVLKWMGHDNLTTTQGYAHLVGSNLNKAMSLLEPVASNDTEKFLEAAE